MKMEIPVASPAAGKLTSILVSIDDVVAEGQGAGDPPDLSASFPRRASPHACRIKHHRTGFGFYRCDVKSAGANSFARQGLT